MGNCAQTETGFDPTVAISLDDFELKHPIGRGGFGKVWKVTHKKSLQSFAMKEMRKDLIVAKHSVNLIMNERRLLGILKHPFIVNLQYAFQMRNSLYLVLDLMEGGDLRFFLFSKKITEENSLKFLAANIIAGLEYLHSNQIIHKDLKPENLVFDNKGYLHLTDFGIAKTCNSESLGVHGTPVYMAPEVICGREHTVTADYYSLGVILFEIVAGCRPYNGNNRKEVRDNILAKQVQLKINDGEWSAQCCDFINKLLQRRPEERLGADGIEKIKQHEWMEGFDWENMYKKSTESPFKIGSEGNFDYSQVNQKWPAIKEKVSDIASQKLFAGYSYDPSIFSLSKPSVNRG